MIDTIGLKCLNEEVLNTDAELEHGYTCDLLSQILAKAQENTVLITVQSHMNVVAVGSMVGIKAIIACEGHDVSAEVLSKATDEGIMIFSSPLSGFTISGMLWEQGLR